MSTASLDPAGLRRLSGRLGLSWPALALVCAATVANVRQVAGALFSHWSAYDFSYAFYPAAQRLLRGDSLYAHTNWALTHGMVFVYPAFAGFALGPFGLIGRELATHLYMLLCVLMVPLTLWICGVRDWRLYVVAALWRPVQDAWLLGNVSLPLACLTALAWRERDRPLVAGLIVALAISLKPFVWPLALLLIATRRWRALGWAVAGGLALNALSWWTVGFGQIHAYLRLSAVDLSIFWRYGYSLTSIAARLGFGRGVGDVAMVAVAALLVGAIVWTGRRGREDQALTLSVALMLVASPIVWSHYFVLLLVPLATARRRLCLPWLAPIAMWVCSPMVTAPGWEVAVAWAATAAALAPANRSDRGGRMLDWLMALTRPSRWLTSRVLEVREQDRCRVSAFRPITTMSGQPKALDNESTDPHLSRDGKI